MCMFDCRWDVHEHCCCTAVHHVGVLIAWRLLHHVSFFCMRLLNSLINDECLEIPWSAPAVIMCICIIMLLLLCCWPCYRLMLSFDENVHACCFLNPLDLPRISPWTVSAFLFNAIWRWCLVARQIGPLGWDWFSHDVGHINKPVPVPCYYVFLFEFCLMLMNLGVELMYVAVVWLLYGHYMIALPFVKTLAAWTLAVVFAHVAWRYHEYMLPLPNPSYMNLVVYHAKWSCVGNTMVNTMLFVCFCSWW